MRMGEGRETFNRLLNWDRGQAPSERLAAIILSNEGFMGIDPSHPLGGKDGLKDMTLSFEGKRWIGAVYFPRGQQTFTVIKDKFIHDLDGVKANGAKGLVFVTNQELRLNERKILSELAPNIDMYDERLPKSRIRDHDNMEEKQVVDALGMFFLQSDGGLFLNTYHVSVISNQDRTVLFLMPQEWFPSWLQKENSGTDISKKSAVVSVENSTG